MLSIKSVSTKPCFICGSRERTVEVTFADKTFRGVLCLNHVHEKLKEVPHAASQPTGKPS